MAPPVKASRIPATHSSCRRRCSSKYLDAGKKVASHAVLLPDGIRFSAGATTSRLDRRDPGADPRLLRRFTDIRRRHAGEPARDRLRHQRRRAAAAGKIPAAQRFEHRDALAAGAKSFADVAREDGLNAKYLRIALVDLERRRALPVLDAFPGPMADCARRATRPRSRRRSPMAEGALAVHQRRPHRQDRGSEGVDGAGQPGGRRTGTAAQDAGRASSGEVTLYLVAGDAGDGNEHDVVVWDKPRLVRPGRPDLLLARRARSRPTSWRRCARQGVRRRGEMPGCRRRGERRQGPGRPRPSSRKSTTSSPRILAAWLDYLGIGTSGGRRQDRHTAQGQDRELSRATTSSRAGAAPDLPNVVANSSNQHVRIPGQHEAAQRGRASDAHACGWQPAGVARPARCCRSPARCSTRIPSAATG